MDAKPEVKTDTKPKVKEEAPKEVKKTVPAAPAKTLKKAGKRGRKKVGKKTGNKKCRICSSARGLIHKYGLHVCRRCFRERAKSMGFKKY